ncbi:hypothetical protein PVK06_019926 [Gossypium arboreum]|uniref:Uncharacterized protein n=1 Tax=Gossypium arboreum TaxID=29729 RepID=A0ABR0PL31_GOSAR|nr:hypothetical protein PVK06_019926 [Gossypium arboreum]
MAMHGMRRLSDESYSELRAQNMEHSKYSVTTPTPVLQNRHQVCIGKWIHKAIFTCISGKKVKIFFAHLVIVLYKKAKVLMSTMEHSVKLMKSIFGNSIYTHYVKLNHKHIHGWNAR